MCGRRNVSHTQRMDSSTTALDDVQIVSAFDRSDNTEEQLVLLHSLGDVPPGPTGQAHLLTQALTAGPGRQDHRTVALWTLAKFDLDEDVSAKLAPLLRDRSGLIQESTAMTLAERGTRNVSSSVLAWLRKRLGKSGRAVVDGGWPDPADIAGPLLFAHRHGLSSEVQPLILSQVEQLHPREVEWLVELGLGLDEAEWPSGVTTDVDSLRRWLYEGVSDEPANLEEIDTLVSRLNSP